MSDGSIYPIYAVIADGKRVGESEMLGNIFHLVERSVMQGAQFICIEKTKQVVDARVPSA